jgi:hypothetical protein
MIGSIDSFSLVRSSFLPFLPLLRFLPSFPSKTFDLYLEYSAAVMLPFLVGGVFLVYRVFVLKSLEIRKYRNVCVVFLVCFFWVEFLSFGVVSGTFALIPVINKFRFLFKGYFLLIPLLGVFFVVLLPVMAMKTKRILLPLVVLFSLLGIANNFVVYADTRSHFVTKYDHYSEHIFVPEKKEKLDRYKIDGENYRSASFFSNSYLTMDKMQFYKALNRNYPTLLGIFSLSAYEIASPRKHLSQFNMIYADSALMTVYGNNGENRFIVHSLEHYPMILEEQLVDNSVKYFLIQKDSVYTTDFFVDKINALGSVNIESVKKWDEDYSLITLEGIPSICRFNDSTNVSLNADYMDLLSFKANMSGKYTLSISYEDKLTAYTINNDGKKEQIKVYETSNGNVELVCEQGRYVFLTYKEPLAFAAQILELLTLILFLLVSFEIFFSKKGESLC